MEKVSKFMQGMRTEENLQLFKKKRMSATGAVTNDESDLGTPDPKLVELFGQQYGASAGTLVSEFFDNSFSGVLDWFKFEARDDEWVKKLATVLNHQPSLDKDSNSKLLLQKKVNLQTFNILDKYTKNKVETKKMRGLGDDSKEVDIIVREIIGLSVQGVSRKLISEITKQPLSRVDYMIKLDCEGRLYQGIECRPYIKTRPEKLQEYHTEFIASMIAFHDGFVSLRDIRKALLDNFAELTSISLATLSIHLKTRMNLSKKKIYTRNIRVLRPDRDVAVQAFSLEIFDLLNNDFDIVNIDESSFMIGGRGGKAWSTIGDHKVVAQSTNKVESVSLVFGISLKGHVFGQFIRGGCTAAIFGEFLDKVAVAMTGKNYRIMLDNATAHKSRLVRAVAKHKRIRMAFPPPYSPEYCPVEMAFSLLKSRIMQYYVDSRDSLTQAITYTTRSISPQYCRSIFGHAFYKLTNQRQVK